MTTLICVVEGDGDVSAFPELLRRITGDMIANNPGMPFPQIPFPIRVKRGSFLSKNSGEAYRAKYLSLARGKAGDDGRVLVLLDADDDCPAQLSKALVPELTAAIAPVPIGFVVAKREFETWFIAAAESIAGRRTLAVGLASPANVEESVADAKGWLKDQMPHGCTYSETVDQPALASIFDWQMARSRSPSLDKLCRELTRLIG